MQAKSLAVVLLVLGSWVALVALAQQDGGDDCSQILCPEGTRCRQVGGMTTCVCPRARCMDRYRPVCGSDGKTYPNACYLRNAFCGNRNRLSIEHEGECREPAMGQI